MFSFDREPRNLTGLLYRIGSGDFEITLSEDRNGSPGKTLFTEKKRMKRFDEFTVPVPPLTPVMLTIRRVKEGTVPFTASRPGNGGVRVRAYGAFPARQGFQSRRGKIGKDNRPPERRRGEGHRHGGRSRARRPDGFRREIGVGDLRQRARRRHSQYRNRSRQHAGGDVREKQRRDDR